MERYTEQEKRRKESHPEESPLPSQQLPEKDDSKFSDRLGRLLAGQAENIGEGTYRLVKTHWLGLVNLHLFIFIGGALVAPCLSQLDLKWVPQIVYQFYGLFCHQKVSRSFLLFGGPVAICARCLFFYTSALVVGMWVGLRKSRPLDLKLALMLGFPAIISVLLQSLGLKESTNLIRVTTGALLGTAVSLYLFPRAQRAVERLNVKQDTRPLVSGDVPRQAESQDLSSKV